MKIEKAQFNKNNVLTIIKGMKLRASKGVCDKKLGEPDRRWFGHAYQLLRYLEGVFRDEEHFEMCLKTAKSNIKKLEKKYGKAL